MNLFQLILVFVGLTLLVSSRILYSYKKITKSFLATLIFSSLIMLIVGSFPEITSFFSIVLGIGRGADAVVYLSIIFLFFMQIKINLRLTELEHKLSKFVQNLALENAKIPKRKKTKKK